ncbi:Constitutive coactivator of peroxisome proliferator-activated receptor gamma, partial [Zootermopsis nevadensis]
MTRRPVFCSTPGDGRVGLLVVTLCALADNCRRIESESEILAPTPQPEVEPIHIFRLEILEGETVRMMWKGDEAHTAGFEISTALSPKMPHSPGYEAARTSVTPAQWPRDLRRGPRAPGRCDRGFEDILINAILSTDPPHPGLLTLWQNGSEELRWRVFCAAVSPRLDHRLLRELSPHLVVPAAVLAYLYHEVSDHLLETWEIEALIIQAVVLEEYDVKRLSNLQVPSIHTRAIRISTLFIRSATTMHLLLATCGYPVTLAEALPWRYFDGKLFGCTYHKTMSGGKYEDQCFHK